MPLHAQIACIGGNGLFAFLFVIAGAMGWSEGDAGLSIFMFALAGAAAYTCWVLLKFRRYLSAEEVIRRELMIERMREEIDALKANNTD